VGKTLAWHILDEPFDGMKYQNKVEALEILKSLSKDKLIIVVDHSSEVSEVFHKVIRVENNNGSEYKYESF
jgi:DNA repair exonuclease SbcCD ATPase subunit